MQDKQRDSKRLVELIHETADELELEPREVRYAQFKAYAIPSLEEKEFFPLADRVLKMGAAAFNKFRNSQVEWGVTEADLVQADYGQLASLKRRDHAAQTMGSLQDQRFEGMLERVFKSVKFEVPKRFPKHRKESEERVVNLLLSDLHYGAALDGREVPVEYGVVQEARRTAKVIAEACEYKRDHRDVSSLNVYLNGDIIQGDLGHDKRDGEPLTFQWGDALWILIQALRYAATQYPRVRVYCATGNHGRDTARHEGRATRQKWDSHETKLYYALKLALAHMPNITFEIPLTPYVEYDCFDKSAFFTHGDTVLGIGYPGKSVNTAAAKNKVNEINGARVKQGKRPASLFFIGHVHVYMNTMLDNGVEFISNGCLIPPDPFSVSIGILENQCCQAMWESVQGHIVGDRRPIDVDANTDKDKVLDHIIKPFEGTF